MISFDTNILVYATSSVPERGGRVAALGAGAAAGVPVIS
jgi:hypothetical protein